MASNNAREKFYEREYLETNKKIPPNKGEVGSKGMEGQAAHMTRDGFIPNQENVVKDLGYTDCGCNAGFEGGVCLDPFMGAGTTALVAQKLNRKWVGIELNEQYIKMALQRTKQTVLV